MRLSGAVMNGTDTYLRILYLGPAYGTSLHRAEALRRLGHDVTHVDPWRFLPRQRFTGRIVQKLICDVGGHLFEYHVRRSLIDSLNGNRFDVIWVNSGELFGAKTIRSLREFAPIIVNYNNDDPFNGVGRKRFALYRQAIPEYDLLAILRTQNIDEAYQAGARRVLRVLMSADEVVHAHMPLSEEELKKWQSDLLFVGTWMPERGPFLARLLELGVPLKFYGDNWQKAKEWNTLKDSWAGAHLDGISYTKAIQCAKVCLGMLSKWNRDQHTRRSAEIPYIGSVLCAERTPEHQALYTEGEEAVYWNGPEECAEKVTWLLENPELRQRIAWAGKARCIRNGLVNQQVASQILEHVTGYRQNPGTSSIRNTGMR